MASCLLVNRHHSASIFALLPTSLDLLLKKVKTEASIYATFHKLALVFSVNIIFGAFNGLFIYLVIHLFLLF